jgi:hypothetical protein
VFDVLAYTDTDVDAPGTWVESDAKLIDNPQMVKLHSFDTKVCPRSRPVYEFVCSVSVSPIWFSIGLLLIHCSCAGVADS